jgi:hypothetical protein
VLVPTRVDELRGNGDELTRAEPEAEAVPDEQAEHERDRETNHPEEELEQPVDGMHGPSGLALRSPS